MLHTTETPLPKRPTAEATPKWCKSTAGDIVLKTYTKDPEVYDADAELARLLAVHEAKLLEAATDPSQLAIGDGPDVLMGWDTEYFDDPVSGVKRIISNQLHLVAEGGELSDIFFSPDGGRISLINRVVRLLLKASEKKVIRQWPRRVIIGAYFLRADLDSIEEFQGMKSQLDSAGGRICTIGKAITYSLLPQGFGAIPEMLDSDDDKMPSITPRQTSTVVMDNGRLRLLSLFFRDMAAYTVMGTPLEAVGEQIGIPKVDIGDYAKDRMDLLLAGDKPLYERYALTDPKIVVKFMAETMLLAKELTGSSELPPTASSLAQKFFLKTLKDAGLDRAQCLGVHTVKTSVWSERADRVRTVTEEVPIPQREDHRAFVTLCYHGGLNSAMYAGPSEIDDWRDWDLKAAYPSAMLSIRLIDFENPLVSTNINDFMGDVIGFAHVEFVCDGSQPFGLLVDGGNRGLLSPRAGRAHCTAAELAVAVRNGVRITKFHHGVIYPSKTDEAGRVVETRLFEPAIREGRRRRGQFPKGSAKEHLMKLMLNSLYGRASMGLKQKKVFDTRSGQSVQMPQSAITNEVVAAHATGAVRATLMEILCNLPAGKRALSVTTDGFICNCSFDELPLNGVMAQRYMDWAELATGKREILEEKHRARQVIVMKTRGQITAEYNDDVSADQKTILAKVGVSPPPAVPKSEHNEYMYNLYMGRRPGQKTQTRPFVSTRVQWMTDTRFTRLTREQSLNLEPDMKNRLINPRMVSVRGGEHIAFDMENWPTAEDGLVARAIFDGWIKKNCLKTLTDWVSWLQHYQLGLARRAKRRDGGSGIGIHMTDEGAVGLLRRLFLRAWNREQVGLRKTISGPKLAEWLTGIGMTTTADDVKNASRKTLRYEEGVVPRSLEVMAALALLQAQFPQAELEKLLVPADLMIT